MRFTVKSVADLAGISIRTLHHYDAIGLLKPAQVSAAGYRLYTEADLERLQQILLFREMEFSLHQIKNILDNPGFDRREALLSHRQVLQARHKRINQLIQTIDRTLDAEEKGIQMEGKTMFEGFDSAQYQEEAEKQWGNTQTWTESQRRTRRYTSGDWDAIKQEAKEIGEAIAARMDRGPDDPEVQTWVQRYHQHINDHYYTCTAEVFLGLADVYLQDERFTAYWEKFAPGMARFMNAAMNSYCNALMREAELR